MYDRSAKVVVLWRPPPHYSGPVSGDSSRQDANNVPQPDRLTDSSSAMNRSLVVEPIDFLQRPGSDLTDPNGADADEAEIGEAADFQAAAVGEAVADGALVSDALLAQLMLRVVERDERALAQVYDATFRRVHSHSDELREDSGTPRTTDCQHIWS
jgi:hypothetical protein